MSEVFHCIVVPMPAHDVQRAFARDVDTDLLCRFDETGSGFTLIHHPSRRNDYRFASESDGIAEILSGSTGAALVFEYDSRVGYRASRLYQHGALIESFGAKDELWAQADDVGQPILSGPRLKIADLDPNKEYEITDNAIELGLKALGVGEWDSIHEVLSEF